MKFFKSAFKVILVCAVIGIATAKVYLTITANHYEAVAEVVIAENSVAYKNLYPLGGNAEDSSPSNACLALSATISYQVISGCAINDKFNSGISLSKSIGLTLFRQISNILEPKTFGGSPDDALIFSKGVFKSNKTTQSHIAAYCIEGIHIKIADDYEVLVRVKGSIAMVDYSASTVESISLSVREQV